MGYGAEPVPGRRKALIRVRLTHPQSCRRPMSMLHYTAIVTLLAVRFLLLHLHARFRSSRQVQREAASDHRRSRLRTRLPRADEHAGVDADLSCRCSGSLRSTSATLRPPRSAFWLVGRILLFPVVIAWRWRSGCPASSFRLTACILLFIGAVDRSLDRLLIGTRCPGYAHSIAAGLLRRDR